MALTSLAGMTPRTPRPVPFCQSGFDTAGIAYADLKHLEHDPALVKKIMNKRQKAAERDAGMFSPRLAKIGLDVAGLNAQVALKQAQAKSEAANGVFWHRQQLLSTEVHAVKEAYCTQKAKEHHKECLEFSITNLRKDQRKEAALNDPDELKKDRAPGKDSSMSSMQYFACEESSSPEHLRQKKQFTKEWLLAQMEEKQHMHRHEDAVNKVHDDESIMANQARTLAQQAMAQESKEEIIWAAQDNIRLAQERRERQQAKKHREQDDERAHVQKVMDHNLERAKHDYSLSQESPGKKIDFKRSTYQEEQQMYDVNAVIVMSKQHAGDREAEIDRAYMRLGNIVEGVLGHREQTLESSRVSNRKRLEEDNQASAKMKREAQLDTRRSYLSFHPDPKE